MNQIQNQGKGEPSALFRWTVLAFISLAMFGNYYIYDSISPLADVLAAQLNFSDSNIGLLQGIYSIPNVFMVLLGGLVIDRIGTKKAALIFSALCVAGALFTVIKGDLAWMATGRLIFGLGAESLIVAITTVIAKWFKGKELSFAFGLNLTIARLGSFAALNSPTWGKAFYDTWDGPLWVAVGAGVISVVSVIIYYVLELIAKSKYSLGGEEKQDEIVLRDIFKFNKSFWFITLLCVTFYSAIFPFQTFAIKFFIGTHFSEIPTGVGRSLGGFLSSLLTLASMILTPIFGLLSDKIGKRATLMMLGSFLLMPVYLIMNFVGSDQKMPEDVLDSINAKEEIVKEFVYDTNDELAGELEKADAAAKDSLLAAALGASKTKALEIGVAGDVSIEIFDDKLKFKSLKPITFASQLGYFWNMIKALIAYYPNLLIPMIIMGIAFSLVPAVMWPSVALIVDEKRLGTAYGLMTMIQNIGLAGFNLLIGWANDFSGDYTLGMIIFSSLGFFGLIFAFFLKKYDSKEGFGLENPDK